MQPNLDHRESFDSLDLDNSAAIDKMMVVETFDDSSNQQVQAVRNRARSDPSFQPRINESASKDFDTVARSLCCGYSASDYGSQSPSRKVTHEFIDDNLIQSFKYKRIDVYDSFDNDFDTVSRDFVLDILNAPLDGDDIDILVDPMSTNVIPLVTVTNPLYVFDSVSMHPTHHLPGLNCPSAPPSSNEDNQFHKGKRTPTGQASRRPGKSKNKPSSSSSSSSSSRAKIRTLPDRLDMVEAKSKYGNNRIPTFLSSDLSSESHTDDLSSETSSVLDLPPTPTAKQVNTEMEKMVITQEVVVPRGRYKCSKCGQLKVKHHCMETHPRTVKSIGTQVDLSITDNNHILSNMR